MRAGDNTNFAETLNFEVIKQESDIYWSKQYLDEAEGFLYEKFDKMYEEVFTSYMFGHYD